MEETFVRLVCPECTKNWQANPSELPDPDESFDCPDCPTTRPTAEFARTNHDLETLKNLG